MRENKIRINISHDPRDGESAKVLEKLMKIENKVGSDEYISEMIRGEGKLIAGFEQRIVDAIGVNYYDLPFIVVALRALAFALEQGIEAEGEDEWLIKGMKEKLEILEKITEITTVSHK